MSKKRIILGCGYVGSALAREWLSQGFQVWGVSRNRETLSEIQHPDFHAVVADVDSHDWHKQVPVDPGVLLNCVSSAGGGMEGYRKSYLGGNTSLLEWSRQADPRRILYTGSTAVYPFSDGRKVFEEDAGGDLSERGEIILKSERMLLENPQIGAKSTVLRLTGIYGPGRHSLLDRLRDGETILPGDGDTFLNLIHLTDIGSAVEALLASESGGGKAYNVSDGTPTKKTEVVRWLADRIGIECPQFDPKAAGGRKMTVNRSGGPPNRQIQIDRIRKEIGWQPTCPSFREGYALMGV